MARSPILTRATPSANSSAADGPPGRASPIAKPEIRLDYAAADPLYRQIYKRLRSAILTGQLESGARLPSTRALASQLGVSRTTTASVYEQLQLEGYIESRVGSGACVARLRPDLLTAPPSAGGPTDAASLPAPSSGLSQRGQLLLHTPAPGGAREQASGQAPSVFAIGQPDAASFPYALWARLIARRARQSLRATAQYQQPEGYYPLREAIASHIGITRGIRCTPEQVLITAGSQGALDLAARALLDPGDAAWIEDPGYLGARGALLAAGARVVPVPLDAEGIDLEAGRTRAPDARIVSVTPSHQFPTGITMTLSRRLALLSWARQARAWIVEDDYDSEYRFSGRPLEALHGLDNGRRVIYVGTFSKVLFPALRLGYLVAPPELVAGFVALRGFVDVHIPILEQLALTDFMAQGYFVRHLRTMRTRYLERRNALIEALEHELGDIVDIHVPEAGLHLVAWLPPHADDRQAADLARRQGVEVSPLSRFCMSAPVRGGLLLGYAGAGSDALRAGVQKLARALQQLDL